jgi:CheY-like chemotaxis protein
VKPFVTDAVFKRLSDVIVKIHPSRQLTLKKKIAASESSKQMILIVDPDPNFRSFFKTVLEDRFVVLEGAGGAEGFELFFSNWPPLIFLGEDLRLPNAHKLAEKIRSIQGAENIKIYLYSATKTMSELPSTEFSGVLRKSFVSDVFLKEFEHIVLGEGDSYDLIVDIICRQLRSDIVTAIQQTFGMMAMQEIELLDNSVAGTIKQEVRATISLIEDTRQVEVTLSLTGTEKDVIELAGKVQGITCESLDVAEDAYGEIINTISGRIRTSMEHYGIRLNPEMPAVQTIGKQDQEYDWKLLIPFRTEGDGHYVLGIAIERITIPAVAPDGSVVY